MLFGKYAAFTVVGLLAIAALPAQSDILASNTAGRLSVTTAAGQSVTVSSGAYSNLTFNWYDANQAPTAAGTLYLLNQEYTGKAGDLSSSTSGFLAASQNIAGGEYIFDPTFTLQGASQYYFYTDSSLTFTGQGNTYSGGILYLPSNNSIGNNFISTPRLDANFLLSGTTSVLGSPSGPNAVPEPSAVTFLVASTLIGAAFLRRRKQATGIA